MTRDFNKQRRDDSRPSNRYQPSDNRQREEQPSRPARPRLNREMVDRGWESGARHDHADYRARSTTNRRRDQGSDYSSAPNNRKPFDSRQGNQYPRPRPFNSDARSSGDTRFNGQDRRGSQDRPGWNNTRPPFQGREAPRYPDQRPPFRDRETPRYPNQRPPFQGGGTPRYPNQRPPFQGSDAPRYPNQRPAFRDRETPRYPDQRSRYDDRDNTRNNERGNFPRGGRQTRDFERDTRSPHNVQQRGPQHPRWQSRSLVQGEESASYRTSEPRSRPRNEQFEGDYERFDAADRPASRPWDRPSHAQRPEAPIDANQQRRGRMPEEQQSALPPDEHTFSNSRPVRRKDEAFWAEVQEESADLVSRVTPPMDDEDDDLDMTEGVAPPQVEEQPRVRKKKGSKAAASHDPVPRPSHRGFKWPTS
ncbi:MAG: hypothetical protein H0W02_17445 [Ktedonobacteraceae bacterium]|nr:hypothetical protein [Ktedonobacteraceae bacterium]